MTKKYLRIISSIALSLVISIVMTKVLAWDSRPYVKNYEAYIISSTLSIILLSPFKLIKYFFFFPFFVLSIFYSITGVMYGLPNVGILASLLNSNIAESSEFLDSTPFISYFYMVLCILLSFIYFKFNFIKYERKIISTICLILGVLFLVSYSPLKDFSRALVKATNDYSKFNDVFKNVDAPIDLEVSEVKPKYDIYVLVIGESVRKDYMSAYGYPINTTPFLKNTNGFLIDVFVSAAPNTVASLTRMLNYSNGVDINPKLNIVSFANQANFNTYWISNQGLIGRHDTPNTKIARLSNSMKFLKKGSFSDSIISDKKLLPYVDIAINSIKGNKNKFIVVHMIGSHPSFCIRLSDGDKYQLKNKDLSCYLSTIHETYDFLSKIFNMLKKTRKTFSMIYISDHGLNNHTKEGNILRVGSTHKSNYEIPFIRLSSDDKERVVQTKSVSGFNFINFFLDWLGIKTKLLKSIAIDTFQSNDVKVYDWTNSLKEFSNLKDDPTNIDPLKK